MGMEINSEGTSDALEMRVTTGRIGILLGKQSACSCVVSEGGSAGRAAPSALGPFAAASAQPRTVCGSPEAQLGGWAISRGLPHVAKMPVSATRELLFFSCFLHVRCRIAGLGIRNSSPGCRCQQSGHDLLG